MAEAVSLAKEHRPVRGRPRDSAIRALLLLLLLPTLPAIPPLLAQSGGGASAHCDVEVTALSAEDTRTQLGTRRSDTLLQMVDGSGLSATLAATTTGGPYVSFRTPQPRWTGQGVPANSNGRTTVTWTDPRQPAPHTYTISAQGCVGTAKQVQIEVVDSRELASQEFNLPSVFPQWMDTLHRPRTALQTVFGNSYRFGPSQGGSFRVRKIPKEIFNDPRTGFNVKIRTLGEVSIELGSQVALQGRIPLISANFEYGADIGRHIQGSV